jgi:hypothetical protein
MLHALLFLGLGPVGLQDARVAVCVAGAARTFTKVADSLAVNVLQALRQLPEVKRVSLFLHLKQHDVSGNTRFPGRVVPPTNSSDMEYAIARLDPDAVEFGDSMAARKGRCPTRIKVTDRPGYSSLDSAINQLFMNYRCAHLVERFEARAGRAFTHVVRARPDLEWTGAVVGPEAWPPQGMRLHDLCYLLPRRLMRPILAAPYLLYEECQDPLAQAFDTGAALWAYRLMDRSQLDANVSFPEQMLYYQAGTHPDRRTPSIDDVLMRWLDEADTNTIDELGARRLCPVIIRRFDPDLDGAAS